MTLPLSVLLAANTEVSLNVKILAVVDLFGRVETEGGLLITRLEFRFEVDRSGDRKLLRLTECVCTGDCAVLLFNGLRRTAIPLNFSNA